MKKLLTIIFVMILLVSTVFVISKTSNNDVRQSNNITVDFDDPDFPPLVNIRLF